MTRDAPAFPTPGEVGGADLAAVVRGVLAGPGAPWCTVVLRGRWAGGAPLRRLWRTEAVHAEGDGLVVVLGGHPGRDGAPGVASVLTLTRPRDARVVHRSGTVAVAIGRVERAVLTDDGEVAPGSFEVRPGVLGARVVDLVTGAASPWSPGSSTPPGARRWRRLAAGAPPLPAVDLVAVI
ncbi:hypothetical protein [Litorihabitans aurantiacus]|uniref:Uncharacterized protein n=1 Tax=Litorihabitans aurantiacus TaxID=1930061 RepID=A0AA38CUE7_9MICO|nr:hypothetical protein [Litorihabitans aurantiacus]GMA33296.1 hypothetical protein GCM10025875_32880 [Litorihabitans aurantiacus]